MEIALAAVAVVNTVVLGYLLWRKDEMFRTQQEAAFIAVNKIAELSHQERQDQRQELQNLFNRIQAPDTAVATTIEGPTAEIDYLDEEREAELEYGGVDGNET